MELRRCKWEECKQTFYPLRKNQVFHYKRCRKAWYEKHYFSKQDVTKTCPICGEKFQTPCPGKQVYCGKDMCKKTARQRVLFSMDDGEVIEGTCGLCGSVRKVGVHNGTGLTLCEGCVVIAKGVESGLADKYRALVLGR